MVETSYLRKLLLAGVCTAALQPLHVTSSYAQEQEASDSLENIIVTARRRAESLLEVPLSITAFGELELQRQNVFALEDLAQFTPGLQFQDVNGAFQNPSLRGLTQTDQTSPQGNVGVFLDGVYLNNRSSLEFGALDLARIEIVKGPQSALYGRNSFGGAINYVTKTPDVNELYGDVNVTVGNRGRYQYGGNINVPLNGVAAMQLFVGISEFDGTIVNNGPGDDRLGGWSGRNSFGGKVYVEPSEKMRLTLFALYNEQDNDAPALVSIDERTFNAGNFVNTPSGQVFTFVEGDLPQFRETTIFPGEGLNGDTELFYGRFEYDFDFATFSTLVSHINTQNDLLITTNNNVDSINQPFFLPIPGISSAAGIDASTPAGNAESYELRLAQDDGGFDWSFGVFHYDAFDADVLEVFFLPIPGSGADPFFFFGRERQVSTSTWAFFGSSSYEVNDKLTVSAELRYTTEDLTLESGAAGPEEISFDYITPRFIIDYQVNDDLLVYFNAGRGVKTGGFAGVSLPGETNSLTFNEESNWSFEIGTKGSFFDNTLTAQIAAYYINWSDVQIQTAIPGSPVSAVQNFGDITSKGVELDVNWTPTEKWAFRTSIAVLDPTYNDGFIDGEAVAPCGESAASDLSLIITKGCTADVSGNTVARTSTFQASFSATYTEPELIKDLDGYIRFDFSHENSKSSTGLDLAQQGDITLANLRFGLASDRLEFAVWVDNLFDQTWNRRVTVAPGDPAFGGNTSGVRDFRVYPGDLRTFGADFTFRF